MVRFHGPPPWPFSVGAKQTEHHTISRATAVTHTHTHTYACVLYTDVHNCDDVIVSERMGIQRNNTVEGVDAKVRNVS